MIDNTVKIIECPRDAMQGIKQFIPSEAKAAYINSLLHVGFDTIDFGSFVSPRAIPQMRDTAAVLSKLNLEDTTTKLLAIVANVKGASDAVRFEQIRYLGYPFSISEIFQMRNTHKTIAESIATLKEILRIIAGTNKQLVVYLSMGFGNPYGEPWSLEIVERWTEKLAAMGIGILSLSDTIGSSNKSNISRLFASLIPSYPDIEFGAHLHTTPGSWKEKIDAAYKAGCRRFDGAIQGFGGCPMAKHELTGNMPTEKIISYMAAQKASINIKPMSFEAAYNHALKLFGGV